MGKKGTYDAEDLIDCRSSESESETDVASSASSYFDPMLQDHLRLLNLEADKGSNINVSTAPIFTEPVRIHGAATGAFSQYGLLGGQSSKLSPALLERSTLSAKDDPRVYWNTASPSSVFICGSQGSGKSHALSCLLENCLVQSSATVLPRPLTAVVFHYDTFASDSGGTPCEVAYLSSNPSIKVRVVCAPTNVGQIKRIYSRLPNVEIEELRLKQTDLDTKRMLDLMAVTTDAGAMPLYLHVVIRVLRDLRIIQQQNRTPFDYGAFKRAMDNTQLTKDQLNHLQQRLETLESFMVKKEAVAYDLFRPKNGHKEVKKPIPKQQGTSWEPKAGQLTIVDLSCPCITPEMASSMFNLCLGLVLEQDTKIGRVIALDEAHKYMSDSGDSLALTQTLLSTIRLQRHLGARIIISTQEPTISPRLLDLCTATIVHRFTSPDWLHSLKKHLAGASLTTRASDAASGGKEPGASAIEALDSADLRLLAKIVALNTGEALLFSPNALIGVENSPGILDQSTGMDEESLNGASLSDSSEDGVGQLVRLGNGVMKIRIRKRVTSDGGRSIMAA